MTIKKGIDENIKLAVTVSAEVSRYSPVLLGGVLPENLSSLSTLGYDALELHWGNPSQINLAGIASACKNLGIVVSAFATGRAYVQEGLSLIHDDEAIRKAAIKRLFDFTDAAEPFNATVIIGCIRGNLKAQEDSEFYFDRLAQSTRLVADYARDKGVPLVFEAINRYENNYLNTAADTLAFIKNYDLPNTKILLDTFHMNIEDADMAEAILCCGKMVGYIHFADSNRLYPGAGHINFKEIVHALKAIDYCGFISAECLPLPDSGTAIQKWIKGVKSAF